MEFIEKDMSSLEWFRLATLLQRCWTGLGNLVPEAFNAKGPLHLRLLGFHLYHLLCQ